MYNDKVAVVKRLKKRINVWTVRKKVAVAQRWLL